jgi:hypothetical protein
MVPTAVAIAFEVAPGSVTRTWLKSRNGRPLARSATPASRRLREPGGRPDAYAIASMKFSCSSATRVVASIASDGSRLLDGRRNARIRC